MKLNIANVKELFEGSSKYTLNFEFDNVALTINDPDHEVVEYINNNLTPEAKAIILDSFIRGLQYKSRMGHYKGLHFMASRV